MIAAVEYYFSCLSWILVLIVSKGCATRFAVAPPTIPARVSIYVAESLDFGKKTGLSKVS